MDNVTSAITSLQRTVEQNQLATQAQFGALRDKIDESEWRLLNRMDRQFYWLMGFMMVNMTATIGVLVRLFGT